MVRNRTEFLQKLLDALSNVYLLNPQTAEEARTVSAQALREEGIEISDTDLNSNKIVLAVNELNTIRRVDSAYDVLRVRICEESAWEYFKEQSRPRRPSRNYAL